MRNFFFGLTTGLFISVIAYIVVQADQPPTLVSNIEIRGAQTAHRTINCPEPVISEQVSSTAIKPISAISSDTSNDIDNVFKGQQEIKWQEDELTLLLSQNPTLDIDKLTGDIFTNEPTDPEWASEQQLKIYDLFTKAGAISSIVPSSIVCKTQRCLIKIPVFDIDDINQKSKLFFETLNQSHKQFNLANKLITKSEITDGQLNIYVYRNDQISFYH